MIISEELAREIVNTIMNLLHRNVNIFNREGIIIATGHPHRYGTFHKGAKDAVDTGKVIEIYPDQVPEYPGALQGINLPVVFDGQIIGAVGVFGHPDEVRYIGKLVKAITELILQYDSLQKESTSKHALKAKFMDYVMATELKDLPHQATPVLDRTVQDLGLNTDCFHTVSILAVQSLIDRYAAGYGLSYLLLEHIEEMILKKCLDSQLLLDSDIAQLIDGRLIIVKAFDQAPDNEQLHQWGEKLRCCIREDQTMQLACGIGSTTRKLEEYHLSYKQALYCLKHCTAQQPLQTIYDHEVLVNYALEEASRGAARIPLGDLRDRLKETNFGSAEMVNTVNCFLNSGMNIKAAAATLGIHRNTLLYRLNCLQEETGLDLSHSVYDAVLCKLLFHLKK